MSVAAKRGKGGKGFITNCCPISSKQLNLILVQNLCLE